MAASLFGKRILLYTGLTRDSTSSKNKHNTHVVVGCFPVSEFSGISISFSLHRLYFLRQVFEKFSLRTKAQISPFTSIPADNMAGTGIEHGVPPRSCDPYVMRKRHAKHRLTFL